MDKEPRSIMNYPFVFRQLSAVCAMLGGFMFLALPWATPVLGGQWQHEASGVFGLLLSILVCFVAAGVFRYLGLRTLEHVSADFFSKREAIAVVGLTWILATILGALPYLIAGVHRAEGTPMSVCDALFESQSGFSTTGATVFGELERPDLLPRCILFWRCGSHFLGGLGIMVLFVVLLGYGTGTKTILRSEMTGPTKSNPKDRIQELGRIVFTMYAGMNVVQTALLIAFGLPVFDALCHSFSTVSTGGFSTYNASAGHFAANGYTTAAAIEWTFIVFMFLGGMNFVLLYLALTGKFAALLKDTEWRTYVGIILFATAVIFAIGLAGSDFDNYGTADRPFYVSEKPDSEPAPHESVPALMAFRVTVFQVVSIATTTGLCTDEYEKWSGLSCCALLILVFLGGCAGSTSGGFKIIRAVCLMRSLPQEIEQAFRPNVVRPLFVGGMPVDRETVRSIMVHFTLMATIFVVGTFLILCFEPASTWGGVTVAGDRKLTDTASAVACSLNNVGPGLGLIGARQNFGVFSEISKFIFTWIMMLGRLELFVILAMFHPGFWRK